MTTPIPTNNIWSFNYRRGSAFLQAHVRARDEATAYEVAKKWCEMNGLLLAAKVSPMIVADESILSVPVGPKPLGIHADDAVMATTDVLTHPKK